MTNDSFSRAAGVQIARFAYMSSCKKGVINLIRRVSHRFLMKILNFESKFFDIFWLIFRKFEVARARWGVRLAGSEERIEKFVHIGENEPTRKCNFFDAF